MRSKTCFAFLLIVACRPRPEPAAAPEHVPVATPAPAPTPNPAMNPEVKALRHGENFRLESGPLALEVDPRDGGRIIEFSLDGRNAMVTRAESPDAYGTSFWPSPQTDWKWPPPIEIDRGAWQAELVGSEIRLASAVHAPLELSVSQRIRLETNPLSAVIDYTLHNHGAAPRRVAPWQNTRVRPGGLTFYPSTEATLPHSALKLAPTQGVTFFAHDPATMKLNQKSFADGHEGFLAHVDGDILFVKVFPDVAPKAAAPGEAEIELYVDGAGKFVEVEQQGAYAEIPAGGTSGWTVRWLLDRVAKDSVVAGNVALVTRARSLAASARAKP